MNRNQLSISWLICTVYFFISNDNLCKWMWMSETEVGNMDKILYHT